MVPLPDEFLRALEGREELLVTSREGANRGTVRVWFVTAPPGVVYLFTFAFSIKAKRWRLDPWVRLTVPGTRTAAEGVVRVVPTAEVDPIAAAVVDRWGMFGATTIEGLRRLISDGSHLLLRVEGARPHGPTPGPLATGVLG